MTEKNKGGRQPVPDHLKRKRRIYWLNDAEALEVGQFIAEIRDPSAIDNRPPDKRRKRESK